MLALALGLASSLSWGAGDFFGGMQAKRLPGIVVVAVSQAVALGALAVAFIASSALSLTITAEEMLRALDIVAAAIEDARHMIRR